MDRTVVLVITLDASSRVVKERTVRVPRFWTASRIMREFSRVRDYVTVLRGPKRVMVNLVYRTPDEIIY
jgi:hypothetical protein